MMDKINSIRNKIYFEKTSIQSFGDDQLDIISIWEWVPWDHIIENKFEYLSERGGHGGHLAEKFLKIYCSYPELSRLPYCHLPVITRQQLAISVIISKQCFLTFKCL